MRVVQCLLALIVVVVLAVRPAAAEQPLTGADMERFIASFSDIRKLAESEAMARQTPADPANPMGSFMTALADSGAYAELTDVARRHGFSSMSEWVSVANRIVRAFLAHSYGGEMSGARAEMEAARKAIEADTSMPPEQKKLILQRMELSAQMAKMFESPPEDQAIVAAYAERLETLFE